MSELDPSWDDAISLGRANQQIVELSRRHCLNMTFVESGGRGAAEASTGLPINMRQVRCPVALGDGMAMNLEWIAIDFYSKHCIGCAYRRPTGEVPNLATFVDKRNTQSALEVEERRRAMAALNHRWTERTRQRQAVAATASVAMAGALNDIGVLDSEPGREVNASERDAARRRLIAVADRTPQLFTRDVVELAVTLIAEAGIVDLLEVLRHVARTRDVFAPEVVVAAVGALRRAPVVEAGRCVAELAGHITAGELDEAVLRSLVVLAGAPAEDQLGRRTRPSETNDPAGLRAAATIVPDLLADVLGDMLPESRHRVAIVVPPGSVPRQNSASDFDRVCAATAVRALAVTHTQVAARLVPKLVRDLALSADNRYEMYPVAEVQRTLAVLLVLGIGDVAGEGESAAAAVGRQLYDPVFGIYQRAAYLLDPNDRFREPGDPQPDTNRRAELFDLLLRVASARLVGDWGDDVRRSAATLVEQLADRDRSRMLRNLATLLGEFLTLLDALNTEPVPTLTTIDTKPPILRAMERQVRRQTIGGSAATILNAVEKAAGENPRHVSEAIVDLMAEERDTERGEEARWRLLPVLGVIGHRHGDEPGLLRAILPTLHSYIVDKNPALRAHAIDAWVDIGQVHELPSSLADLLPALTADQYVAVISSVLKAARRLTWERNHRLLLLQHAVGVLLNIDAKKHPDVLKEAVATAITLAEDIEVRSTMERLALNRAADLDGYDLRDVLDRRRWLPQTTRSTEMARLRLRQARDPNINDRFNASDDDELCALLESGPGLVGLPLDELKSAALSFAPDYPLASAEFAEVAWRAGRVQDAAAIMAAVLETIPDQPAYQHQRDLTRLVQTAANFDGACIGNAFWSDAAVHQLAEALAAFEPADGEWVRAFGEQVKVRATIRHLLTGKSPDLRTCVEGAGREAEQPANPVISIRRRADLLTAAGSTLSSISQHDTATGAYARAYAALCEIGSHLLRADTAVLEADTSSAEANLTAAQRRADVLLAQLTERFDPSDPLADRLIAALRRVGQLALDEPVAICLQEWAAYRLPLLIVRGPRARSHPPTNWGVAEPKRAEESVAVTLVSIDDSVVDGPQVLRPNLVYKLALEVHPGTWPEWAERLDAEFLTHLSASEVTLPTFTWRREARTPDQTYTKSGSLVLRFGLAAGQPAPPFMLKLRWRGERTSEPIDVAGHRELRIRPFDASRDFLTDYPVFDERLLKLYEGLMSAGYDHDQLQAFCRLLTAICRVGLRFTWDKRYRRGTRIKERTFHDDLYERLLVEPELGGRLDRGSPLALGFLDVRHDGITAELKVERNAPVNQESAPKYIGQPTQYAAADGARLSILTILDMSQKELPVGTPENYLFTLQPQLHGLTNPEAPSLVAVVVVNGNMPPPSTWSRRKSATVQSG